ncbi:ATP-dependent DNA helicase RecG [Dysgonomonas sp. PFB1-18]|uniref:ATP-dependent DNA helicase RecG n=1 Tax=unclassified Dysgonomonas TaxID=2630389 RepID=UPI0024745867|nr:MULTISPECIES: ATP-dependent DNA helicase RecG [unclassified Dysgonomonas]MDL2303074.1 ATP-dependent DNA helicase RecG [Dysgonomonas sp. OttesenSCG-928-D17]MDH6307537.1 ATP-dependent DNA helicase RecG [Dysgonomonas sp. PF1-14]MDH6337455.1 ATP-dependent DNA helicase RecG [Dysgonomonas sp. PF1-16]MDH6379379.1 ATP-dependent DNA helicase RecG [Dysgonomonas sp. PFB1-18]MDH6395983.1 ATP-dependent DNA helicase RecG [Dysgonomonas sp. PF1-23]
MADYSQTDIKYLAGVGPKKAEILNKEADIFSVEDLLYYFPYKYIDRSRIYFIHEIDGNMPYIQLKGRITAFETFGEGRKKRLVAHFTDGTGFIDLVWFQGAKFIADKYKVNLPYIIFGKPTLFGDKFNIAHPDVDPYINEEERQTGLMPYYNTTEKMKTHYLNSKAIQKIMAAAFASVIRNMAETLPEGVIKEAHVMGLKEAMRNVHFPENTALLRDAQYRLKFEELFYIQLNILKYTADRKSKLKGFVFTKVGDYLNSFYEHNLPFPLTNAQKRIIKEIRQDMATGEQMNRLLQGDVGSGKTLVALMLMLIALDNGFQAAMMAPTEILATQHYYTLEEQLEGLGVNVELLTGSTKKADRERIHNGLLTGDVQILIGTHALIEDTVQFSNLGLVVIDEQHRFGVAQRAKLWSKNVNPPHILVMTATPIPRTLAMTVYGDLDVSVIDELPPGRKPIQTIHQYDKKRGTLYESIRKQLQEGRQVYIVYPLIEESEKLDLKNLEEGFKHIQEVFPEYTVCKVHGKMKPKEKDAEMQRFVNNEAQIMVATTVIEVGVNVPNASVMVIESAQRFGLSQLHQLRGRVGRGADQSYCILVTPYELSADTRKRIDIMVESNDGFIIAEADLKLRGPGDLEGTQQSGIPFNLRIANIVRDSEILQYAREVAQKVLDEDPQMEHPDNLILRRQLRKLGGNRYNWGLIS